MRFCVLILCRLAKGQRVHVHLLESLVKGLGLKKKKGEGVVMYSARH